MSATAAAAAAAADSQARPAKAREPGPGDAGAVRAAIVLGDDLDIFMPRLAIAVSKFDAHIGEVDLVVEVGQTVPACPLPNLVLASIRMTAAICAVPITLMEPALVLPLELVVEDDAFDVRATVLETCCSPFVRPIDLDVVCELPLAFDAMPEGLAVTLIAIAMVVEQTPAFSRERDDVLP